MDPKEKKDKRKALIISIIVYVGFAVLFLFIGLKYPDPPLEETGIEISMADFGYDDSGSGEIEPSTSTSSPVVENNAVQEETNEVTEEPIQDEVVTQSESEISVPENSTEVVEETPNNTPVEEIPEQTQVVEEIEPEINENLQNALGAWQETESATSEGGQEGTVGNEGIESGNNDGRGTFGGNGSSFELGGRSLIAGPSIGERPKEEGKVVLNIWVNREGNILRVSHNLKESTTTSQYLFNLAKKSAQKAKFNPSPNSAPEQRGKMTFIFILQ